MIYTAKEAREAVSRLLSVEHILQLIYKCIKANAETGNNEAKLRLSSLYPETIAWGFTYPMMEVLRSEEAQKEIVEKLKSLGYKVHANKDIITIEW